MTAQPLRWHSIAAAVVLLAVWGIARFVNPPFPQEPLPDNTFLGDEEERDL